MKKYLLSLIALSLVSSANAVTLLDFGNSVVTNNIQNGATSAADGEIRWGSIANVDGQQLDLVATVSGGTYYAANMDDAKLVKNGLNGEFGNININNNINVDFTFTIVEAGTNTAVQANSWDFAVFDIDQNSGGSNVESITVVDGANVESYTISGATEIGVTGLYPNNTFTATSAGGAGDNPTDPTNLTALQEARTILFTLTGTSSFTLNLSTTTGNSGRNILFAGEAVFQNPNVVTGVPEPSSVTLLGVVGSVFLLRRKR